MSGLRAALVVGSMAIAVAVAQPFAAPGASPQPAYFGADTSAGAGAPGAVTPEIASPITTRDATMETTVLSACRVDALLDRAGAIAACVEAARSLRALHQVASPAPSGR